MNEGILIAMAIGLLTNVGVNVYTIFILSDLRDRVRRLEDRAIPPEYRGPGPHPHMKETIT